MDNINQIKFGNPINDYSSNKIIRNDIIIVRNDNTQSNVYDLFVLLLLKYHIMCSFKCWILN